MISPDQNAAAWCSHPIAVGQPGFVLAPTVIGPDAMPLVTDAAVAADNPEWAFLSALIYPEDKEVQRALEHAIAALQEEPDDEDRAALYSMLASAILPDIAPNPEEPMHSYIETSPNMKAVRQSLREIEAMRPTATAMAKALIAVFESRGIEVSELNRVHFTYYADVERLDSWIRRAATATSTEEVIQGWRPELFSR